MRQLCKPYFPSSQHCSLPSSLDGKRNVADKSAQLLLSKGFQVKQKSQKDRNTLSFMDLLAKYFTSVTQFLCTLKLTYLSGKASSMLLAKPTDNPALESTSE